MRISDITDKLKEKDIEIIKIKNLGDLLNTVLTNTPFSVEWVTESNNLLQIGLAHFELDSDGEEDIYVEENWRTMSLEEFNQYLEIFGKKIELKVPTLIKIFSLGQIMENSKVLSIRKMPDYILLDLENGERVVIGRKIFDKTEYEVEDCGTTFRVEDYVVSKSLKGILYEEV